MKIYNRDLRRARRWLASGRNAKVIHFLEPKVPLFIEDPQYYAILGRACLESRLLKDAETYLNRGLQADPRHLEVRLALAVYHLKKKDPAGAVRTWLEILEDYPGEKLSSRGLKSLKKITDPHQQDRFLDRFDPRRYLPNLKSKWPGRFLILLGMILFMLVGFYFRDSIAPLLAADGAREYRPGSENLLPASGRSLTNSGVEVLYPMTDAEVMKTLKRSVDLYQEYKDNQARHELNKIRYSNAADDIRQQAVNLINSLGEPTIENIDTVFTYSQVNAAPWLYDGCMVLWKGMTANVVYGETAIQFDFLVGFDEGRILEGRVPVEVPFLAVMEPLPLELLARVTNRDGSFSLVGKTLHFLR